MLMILVYVLVCGIRLERSSLRLLTALALHDLDYWHWLLISFGMHLMFYCVYQFERVCLSVYMCVCVCGGGGLGRFCFCCGLCVCVCVLFRAIWCEIESIPATIHNFTSVSICDCNCSVIRTSFVCLFIGVFVFFRCKADFVNAWIQRANGNERKGWKQIWKKKNHWLHFHLCQVK